MARNKNEVVGTNHEGHDEAQIGQTLAFPFLAEFNDQINITQTSLELPQKLATTQWEEIGRGLGKIEQATLWWIGDWWAFGEHQYGDRKELVESESWTGPSYQTCKDCAWITGKFETSRRRDLLPFWYHREVAALPPVEADRLLDWCEEPLNNSSKRSRTIRELREEVKKVKAYVAQGWNASQLERKAEIQKGMAVVANMHNGDNGLPLDNALITWAEAEGLAVRIDRSSDWGNPFEVDADGTRAEVIEWYAEYFAHKRSLHKRLDELCGRVLVCWCYPEACHGDFLATETSCRSLIK